MSFFISGLDLIFAFADVPVRKFQRLENMLRDFFKKNSDSSCFYFLVSCFYHSTSFLKIHTPRTTIWFLFFPNRDSLDFLSRLASG